MKIFLVRTTPKSIRLMAHRTGRCLETKEAFKAEKAGLVMALPFYLYSLQITAKRKYQGPKIFVIYVIDAYWFWVWSLTP